MATVTNSVAVKKTAEKKTSPKKTAEKKTSPKVKKTTKKVLVSKKTAEKKTAEKKTAEKKTGKRREPKWLVSVLKTLLKYPDGLTRKELCNKLDTQDFSGVLVKNPELISQTSQEGVRGFVYVLTAAGRNMAKANAKKA